MYANVTIYRNMKKYLSTYAKLQKQEYEKILKHICKHYNKHA